MLQNPHTNTPLSQVLDRLRNAAAQDFDQACPIPPEVNHSSEFHQHEQQTVFSRSGFASGARMKFRRQVIF